MTLSTMIGGQVYRMGSSGPAVKEAQLALAKLGFPLGGSGYFGPATMTAVRSFQKKAGLAVDGDLGPQTAASIDLALGGKVESVTASPRQEITRPLWLQAGIQLIGTQEGRGSKDNRTIIEWAKEEGGDVAKEYTHDSIPWCSLFANHCATLGGIQGTHTLWALDWAGNWPSVRLDGPALGAFAPMLRSGGGHIIQIAGRDQHGRIMGLGGNQSDAVNIEPFPLSRLNKGFWWPKGIGLPLVGFNHLPLITSNGSISAREA